MWPVEDEGPSFTKNLLSSSSGTSSDGDMDEVSYTYEYNDKGLPTKIISDYSYQYTDGGTQYTETGTDVMNVTHECK